MVKRLLKSILIGVLLVSGAVALSNYARAQNPGTGGSSGTGTDPSRSSSQSGSYEPSRSSSQTGSATGSGSMGSGYTTETGTGGGADAGRKVKDAGK
jgi:hypothetical protein